MDSTLALGAFRIARGAGGEAVREREPRRAGEASPKPPPKPRSGLCPELLADFRSETSWVLAGGAEGSFLCSLITDFLAEGAGWGASPGRGGELGCQAQQVLKKMCEIGVGFSFSAHSESFESQGARAAKRYVKGNLVEREKGDEFGIKLLLPHRLSPVGSKKGSAAMCRVVHRVLLRV